MNRFTVVTTAVLAFAVSAPLLATSSTPASAQGPRDSELSDQELLELFVDRFRTRREMRDLFEERFRDRDMRRSRDGDLRERFRERSTEGRGGRDDDDDDDDDDHAGRNSPMRERMAHFRRGRGGGDCYFITRSVRDRDGDFFALTRRRICRD